MVEPHQLCLRLATRRTRLASAPSLAGLVSAARLDGRAVRRGSTSSELTACERCASTEDSRWWKTRSSFPTYKSRPSGRIDALSPRKGRRRCIRRRTLLPLRRLPSSLRPRSASDAARPCASVYDATDTPQLPSRRRASGKQSGLCRSAPFISTSPRFRTAHGKLYLLVAIDPTPRSRLRRDAAKMARRATEPWRLIAAYLPVHTSSPTSGTQLATPGGAARAPDVITLELEGLSGARLRIHLRQNNIDRPLDEARASIGPSASRRRSTAIKARQWETLLLRPRPACASTACATSSTPHG